MENQPPETEARNNSVANELRLTYEAAFATFASKSPEKIRSGVFPLLRAVAATPGINLKRLSVELGRDKSTLSISIKTLLRDQYIDSERNALDKRKLSFRLTSKGEEYLQTLSALALIHDHEIDAILGKDKQVLLDILARLRAALG